MQKKLENGLLAKMAWMTMASPFAHSRIEPSLADGKSHSSEQAVSELWRCRVQKRLENGSLVKVRLDNKGIASGLYETELKPLHKLALSGQFDATNLEKPPKVRLPGLPVLAARLKGRGLRSCW